VVRIAHQPALAGADMPSILDVWLTIGTIKVLVIYWFTNGRFEVIRHRPGPWEAIVLELADRAPAEPAESHHPAAA